MTEWCDGWHGNNRRFSSHSIGAIGRTMGPYVGGVYAFRKEGAEPLWPLQGNLDVDSVLLQSFDA